MTFHDLSYDVLDSIATITFTRPDQLNSFTFDMGKEIVAALDLADASDEVRAVIFTGAGRAYCAGADLSGGTEIFDRDRTGGFQMERDADYGGVVSRRILDARKPVIGAINGPAIGFGASHTLPMDFRLAADTARFGFVFTRRGLVPEAASSWFLPRMVGHSTAADWVFSGRIFDAPEALAAGLVHSVHSAEDLLPAARDLAHSLTRHSAPVAVAIARRMLQEMAGAATPELAHEIDSRGIHALGRSLDCEEGVAAFMQKREPQFPMTVSADLPAYVARWFELGSAQALVDEAAAGSTGL